MKAALILIATASAAAIAAPLAAQEREDTIIVTAPGGGLDNDDSITASAAEISRAGAPDLLRALNRTVAGLSLSEAQSNPWQPNLVYRGFTASPLQGNSQGLAVYVDGGRFNQPFGDTVQFDLLPEAAIDSVTIKDASPIYGLNALGGALIVATKTGRSAPGVALSAAGGRFGSLEGSAEFGWAGDQASAYIALQGRRDDGWRRFSPSTLYNGFADFGWDGADAGIHLKLTAADTDLTGNGSAPVELLAADRRAVFTHPDNTRNRYGRISLHPWVGIGDTSRIEASLYVQRLRQRTLNGDAADVEACEDDDNEGLLCLESAAESDEDEGDDAENLLIGADGNAIADTLGGEGYGALNRSRTRSRASGLLVQFVDKRPLGAGENELVLGFSHDRSRTRFAASSELGALEEDRSVEGLGPIITQPDGSITPVSVIGRTRYWGLFLSDTLPIAPGLSAEIGVRWNHARVLLDDQIGTALNGRHRFRRLNPGVEIDWTVTPGITLRAGYAEANRAPSPAELSCADEDAPCSLTNFFVGDPPLDQVVSKSWELGAAGHHDGAVTVRWLLSAYRADNHDDIQFIASPIRGRAFFQNVGVTRRQGIDLSIDLAQGPWSARATYGYTDATFRTPLILNSPDNPGADDDGTIAVQRGAQMPGIPRHRGTISVDYSTGRWGVGGDVQAQSGLRLFGDEANFAPRTRPFAIFNLRGHARLFGPVTLFAEMRNLFDKRYATFGTFSPTDEIELEEAPGASDPRSLGPGAPRRWIAGVSAKF